MLKPIKLFFFLLITLLINTIAPMDQPAKHPTAVEKLVASFKTMDLQDGAFSPLPTELVHNIFNFVECKYPWDEMLQMAKARAVCRRWFSILGDLDATLKHRQIPPLHFAAMKNNTIEMIHFKLQKICSLREPDSRGFRAAHYALATKKHDAIRMLKIGHALDTVKQGSEELKAFVVNDDQESLAMLSAEYDKECTAEELMKLASNDNSAELDAILLRLSSPVVVFEALKIMKEQKREPFSLFNIHSVFAVISSLENTLLDSMDSFSAITDDFFKLFRFADANPNVCDEFGRTALARSCADPDFQDVLVNLLMCKGIDVNLLSKKDDNTFTPLHVAALNNNIQAAQKLLEFKDTEGKCRVDINIQDSKGDTALQTVVSQGDNFDLFNLLVQYGADVNIQGTNGFAPIHFAAQNGYTKILKAITDSSACNLEVIDIDGKTPLSIAAIFDQDDCVKYLLQLPRKANIACRDKRGNTLLHLPAYNGSIKSMRELIPYLYPVIDVPNNNSFTPLHYSIMKGHIDCAQLLLSKGAMVNVRTKIGDTPLHYAANNGNVLGIELLIDRGARIDAKNNNEAMFNAMHIGGYTPLHYAVHEGHLEAVRILSHLGANIYTKTALGKTACDLAYEYGHKKIGKYLAERMTSDKKSNQ